MAALLLGLAVQDLRVEELLLRFEEREAVEPADLDALVDALEELGSAALLSIAQALAEDLRDGMAAAAAPALIDALMAHPGMREPLQAVFRDPSTPPAGRIEIARALDDLGDDSWRDELLAMARDPRLDPELRRRAAALLRGASMEVVVDEPRERLVPEPPRRESVARKKEERPRRESATIATALFLGGSLLTLGILLWALRRKD